MNVRSAARLARLVPDVQSSFSSALRYASTSTDKSKRKTYDPVIFTGIQPTGTPHLGNYLGLFLPFLDLQKNSPKSTPLYLSIVGLHAITLPQNPATLREDRLNMLASLVACGVDVDRTTLYCQEDVLEHAELAWMLNTLTPVGRLQRMTTWKSRIATSRNSTSDDVSEADLRLGLLAYPVLQAADIMLYKSTIVPVGEDQVQHLELTRDIVELFNKTYSPIFPLPEVKIVPTKRILSLRDPTSKMSKSSPTPTSRILITDPPSQILSKLKSAITDTNPSITYDPIARPGISNLLTIYSALDPRGRSVETLAEEARRDGWGAGRLKGEVGEVVVEGLRGVREEYERVRKEKGWLAEVARRGREAAGVVARGTMEEVRKVIGLDRL